MTHKLFGLGGPPKQSMNRACARLVLFLLVVAVAAVSGTNAKTADAVRMQQEIGVRPAVSPDTLTFAIVAGRPFMTVLPDSLGGTRVEAVEPLRVPARSKIHGRAFFWQTRQSEQGQYELLFLVRKLTAAPDTLTVLVEVVPE